MENKQQNFSIPMAIVAAGFIIAVGVVAAGALGKNNPVTISPGVDSRTGADSGSRASANIKIVLVKDDHIKGNPDAPITIVEFSDLECPYCKRFHPTLEKLTEEYSQVKWVYKHFPLSSLHSKARVEAIASECAYEQGGDEAFWSYVQKIFAITPSNDGLDLSLLPEIASEIGLDRARFDDCLQTEKYGDKVDRHYDEALTAGGSGTPFNVIVAPDGSTTPIIGLVPYSTLTSIIDELLKNN